MIKVLGLALISLLPNSLVLADPASIISTPITKVTWHGHAAFEITTPKGKSLWIDPWLKNPVNPAAQGGKNPVNLVKKADFILITHGHSDHVGDAVELAQKTHARLITNYELADAMVRVSGYPKAQVGLDTAINAGGEITILDGEVMVAMTPAVHSSGLDNPHAGPKDAKQVYGGSAGGFILKIKNGPTIYDTGDTAYFKDMEVIGETYHPDLALLNIGGHFGMSPEMAVRAAKAVQAKVVVPHHFKTFPILTPDAAPFFKLLDAQGIEHVEMLPGSTISYEGNQLKK